MAEKKNYFKQEDMQTPCPRCGKTDIRRVCITPLQEIWVCYKCGQAQYIKKELPKEVRLEKNKWYRIDSLGQVWELCDQGQFVFRGMI